MENDTLKRKKVLLTFVTERKKTTGRKEKQRHDDSMAGLFFSISRLRCNYKYIL
jgi:hypothetical protein